MLTGRNDSRAQSGALWWLVLAVLAAACATLAPEPAILSASPAVLELAELPTVIVVHGQRLNMLFRVSLNDHSGATPNPVIAKLGSVQVEVAEVVSSQELQLRVPKAFETGTYDLTLTFGSGKSAFLPRALTIIDGTAPAKPNASVSGTATGVTTAPLVSASASSPDIPTTPPSAQTSTTSAAASAAPTSSIAAPGASSTGLVSDADTATETDAGMDSGASATPTPTAPRCGPTEFGAVEVVTLGAGAPTSIWSPALSADGRTLYFAGANSGAVESLFRAARSDRGTSFGDVTRVPSPVPSGPVGTPWLSADGLSLYFYATQASGTGERDLYVSRRVSATDEFGAGVELTSLNSASVDHLPWLTADELTIVYKSQRLSAIGEVLTANRLAKTDAFSAPRPLASLNTGLIDISRPALSADGLRIYFSSSRNGGHGGEDIWYAERRTIGGQFTPPINLDVINTSGAETQVTLSFDGEELMFVGLPAQRSTLYRALAACP